MYRYKEVIFIIVLVLLTIFDAYAEELPLYPENRQYSLMTYEIGVETTVVTDVDVEFTFINFYKDNKKVLTKGVFIIDPIYRVEFLKVQYVLVNKDKRIVKVIDLLNDKSRKNIVRFTHVYPYSPDYEYCVFHIVIDVELIRVEEAALI